MKFYSPRGEKIDYLLGGARYQVARGDILLIPPDISHRPLIPSDLKIPYERFALWLDEAYFHGAMKKHTDLKYAFDQCARDGNYLLRTPRSTWEGLLSAFRSLWQESEQKRLGWQLCVSSGALVLMTHISRTFFTGVKNLHQLPEITWQTIFLSILM